MWKKLPQQGLPERKQQQKKGAKGQAESLLQQTQDTREFTLINTNA